MHYADGEMAWTSFDWGTLRIFDYAIAGSEIKEHRFHPTQKPLAVMKWCIGLCSKEGDTILDPFCGSGTTLVAAVQTGRNAIGIEISEEYCAMSRKRLLNECGLIAKEAENA